MARENGGVVGKTNTTTLTSAVGAFDIKTQFLANYSGIWPRGGSLFIGITHSSSPYVSVYPFSSIGFGTKITNPATLPASTGNALRFAPNGKDVAVAHNLSPFVSVYPFSTTGFGSKYTNPATLPASTGNAVTFNPSSSTIVVGHATTPFVSAYPWTTGTGFGVKYSNPATLPPSTTLATEFSPSGNDLALGTAGNSTYDFSVYAWSSGFGTKYTNPATNPLTAATGTQAAAASFSPNGNYVSFSFVSSTTTDPIDTTYAWTSGVGFGTAYSSGRTQSTSSNSRAVAFSPLGKDLAIGFNNSPYTAVYPWNSPGYGSQYSNPSTLLASSVAGVSFDPLGNFIAMASSSTPYINIYQWTTGIGFGTKLSDPGTLPTGAGSDVRWTQVI